MSKKHKMNPQGVTWLEWVAAAGEDPKNLTSTATSVLYKAWERGEDPTEYRAVGKDNG